jgi:hypothetical protein
MVVEALHINKELKFSDFDAYKKCVSERVVSDSLKNFFKEALSYVKYEYISHRNSRTQDEVNIGEHYKCIIPDLVSRINDKGIPRAKYIGRSSSEQPNLVWISLGSHSLLGDISYLCPSALIKKYYISCKYITLLSMTDRMFADKIMLIEHCELNVKAVRQSSYNKGQVLQAIVQVLQYAKDKNVFGDIEYCFGIDLPGTPFPLRAYATYREEEFDWGTDIVYRINGKENVLVENINENGGYYFSRSQKTESGRSMEAVVNSAAADGGTIRNDGFCGYTAGLNILAYLHCCYGGKVVL